MENKYKEPDTAFLRSLDTLVADDIAPKPPKKPLSLKYRILNTVRISIMVLCAITFVTCSVMLCVVLTKNASTQKQYDDIAKSYEDMISRLEALTTPSPESTNKIPSQGGNTTPGTETQGAETTSTTPSQTDPYETTSMPKETEAPVQQPSAYTLVLQEWFAGLQKDINKDICGFIKVNNPNMNIEQVMVHCDDNYYYLTHNLYGKQDSLGAIYLDSRSSIKLNENRNIVVYGHNMASGAMFHDLVKLENKDDFMNTTLTVSTPDGVFTFDVFAFYRTKETYPYCRTYFANSVDFVNFCNTAQEKSMWKKNYSFDENSLILTISTCTNTTRDGRYAIHFILTDYQY